MKWHKTLIALICCLSSVTNLSSALVVTDNNLAVTDLDNLSSNKNLVSSSFSVDPGKVYRLTGTVASTVTGHDLTPYYILGVSKIAPPTATGDLLASHFWGRTNGLAYSSTAFNLGFTSGAGDSSYYLSLGMGRFDNFKAANYSWTATNLKLNSAAGVAGNLVPNASFENTSVSFWSTGGAFATDAGKHGSNVWSINSQTTSYITIPVIAGQEYSYSFWSASPTIGNGHKIEYGFSVPQNGVAAGAGNANHFRTMGAGAVGWTEYSGTFIPTGEQTSWYLGGMANGGTLQFDSIYLAAVPEPHFYLLLAVGAALPFLRRRRSK